MKRSDATFGNIYKEKLGTDGWILGHFVRPKTHPLYNEDFEIKFSEFKGSDKKTVPALNKRAKSLTVLINGRIRITVFSGKAGKSYILKKRGDFLFWNPGICHTWDTPGDTLVLTARWPSQANDTEPCKNS